MADDQPDVLTLTARITIAYLGTSAHVKADEVPQLIRSIRSALQEGDAMATPLQAAAAPAPRMHATAVKKSITPDALVSFIDGKPYKTLKRHLARHGHDMKSYREAYGLPADYPAVAAGYSAARSEISRRPRLDRRERDVPVAAPAEPEQVQVAPAAQAPAKRGRKKAAAA